MTEARRIDAGDDGIRLDRWFRRHYPALAHGRLEKLLRTGQVRLDGKRVKAADRVATGQAIRLPPQLSHEKPPEKSAAPVLHPDKMGSLTDAILYMDKSVIVLDKPPGLATQGGSGLTRHVDGMLDSLAFEKTVRPRLVHRLDRDTSGVLLVARTTSAAAELSRSLASRDAVKIYWALVKGVPKQKHGVVKAALAREGERMTLVDEDKDGAKFALTEYAVLGEAGDEFAWVAARPLTGRTHQIRVHLASRGHPIIGDFKYGGAEARGTGAVAIKLHLHARSIDVPRPDGGRLKVTAPLPPHMRRSWELLGFDPDFAGDPFAAIARGPRKPKSK